MAFKFITQDNNKNKRKYSVSTKGLRRDSDTKYALSQTANAPLTKSIQGLTKTGQFGGTGIANVMYAQPMFFSPMHTVQNWQIASERREISQWVFHTKSLLLTDNYTYKSFEELNFDRTQIVEDIRTKGILYEDIDSESIMSSEGDFIRPTKASERLCKNKRFFSFKTHGYWREVVISEEHKILVLDGTLYYKKRK